MDSKTIWDLIGTDVEDIELPKEFESALKVYDGISLENNEKTFPEPSPKFKIGWDSF